VNSYKIKLCQRLDGILLLDIIQAMKAILCLFLSGLMLASMSASALADSLSRRVCAERKENKPAWQKEHYAFAMSADSEHCGWSYGHKKVKYAIPEALRTCKRYAGKSPCKIVYSK
jgi:hypothetical protein